MGWGSREHMGDIFLGKLGVMVLLYRVLLVVVEVVVEVACCCCSSRFISFNCRWRDSICLFALSRSCWNVHVWFVASCDVSGKCKIRSTDRLIMTTIIPRVSKRFLVLVLLIIIVILIMERNDDAGNAMYCSSIAAARTLNVSQHSTFVSFCMCAGENRYGMEEYRYVFKKQTEWTQ